MKLHSSKNMKFQRAFLILIIALANHVRGFDIAGFELPDLQMPELEMPELEMPELEMPELEMPELEFPELEMPELPDISDLTGMLDSGSVPVPDDVPELSNSVSTVQETVKSLPGAASTVQDSVQNLPGSVSTVQNTVQGMPSTIAGSMQPSQSSSTPTPTYSTSTTESTSSTTSSASTPTTPSSSSTTKSTSKSTLRDFSSSLIPYQSTQVKEAVQRCRQNVTITKDEALSILMKEVPKTQAGECFLACIKKETGLITEDNKYNMKKVKYTLEPIKTSNENLYNKVIKIFKDCENAGASETDDCEAGKKLRNCVQAKRQQFKS